MARQSSNYGRPWVNPTGYERKGAKAPSLMPGGLELLARGIYARAEGIANLVSGAKLAHAAVPGGDDKVTPAPPSFEGAARGTAQGALSHQELH